MMFEGMAGTHKAFIVMVIVMALSFTVFVRMAIMPLVRVASEQMRFLHSMAAAEPQKKEREVDSCEKNMEP